MKLHRYLLQGIMCAGLAAGVCAAQAPVVAPTPPEAKAAADPADQINKPTEANRNRTTDSKTATETKGHVAGAAGTSDGAMVGKTDLQFMNEAAMGSMAEVQLAQMAQQKASSQEVKDYARKLEQDHTQADNKLKAIAKERQVDLPTDVGPKHKVMIDKLNAMSGADFDRAYTKMMVSDHKKDVKEFEKASNRSMDSDLKEFASTTLPTLKAHLQQAEQLHGSRK